MLLEISVSEPLSGAEGKKADTKVTQFRMIASV